MLSTFRRLFPLTFKRAKDTFERWSQTEIEITRPSVTVTIPPLAVSLHDDLVHLLTHEPKRRHHTAH